MKRLTKKEYIGYSLVVDINDIGLPNCNEHANKLGQLEDIEEELGIDLITLFKALKNGVFTKFDNRIDFHRIIKIGIYVDKIRLIYGGFYYMELKDYGKTWALTKEELL